MRRDDVNAANLRLLKAAGVRIAIGSDNYGNTARSEALYLSDLGVFSNLELLKLWAETTPAVIFPRRKIGLLQDGYEASFLVLPADPLADFSNVLRIDKRVKQGRLPQLTSGTAQTAQHFKADHDIESQLRPAAHHHRLDFADHTGIQA